MPFAIVASTKTYQAAGKSLRGRMYPWGLVEGEKKGSQGRRKA